MFTFDTLIYIVLHDLSRKVYTNGYPLEWLKLVSSMLLIKPYQLIAIQYLNQNALHMYVPGTSNAPVPKLIYWQ